MMIEITVANEAQLVEEYRSELRRIARLLVTEAPERVGKRYANVTMPQITLRTFIDQSAIYKIDWV